MLRLLSGDFAEGFRDFEARWDMAELRPDRPAVIDEDDPKSSYEVVRVRLTSEENERFLALCRRAELPEWEMARKALRAFGLI